MWQGAVSMQDKNGTIQLAHGERRAAGGACAGLHRPHTWPHGQRAVGQLQPALRTHARAPACPPGKQPESNARLPFPVSSPTPGLIGWVSIDQGSVHLRGNDGTSEVTIDACECGLRMRGCWRAQEAAG